MKRCPECEFLYENETTHCDMDGTPLRYTVTLPKLPGLAQSIWDKWTIALLCLLILGTVLVILYRATPRGFTSSAAGQQQLKQDNAVADQQMVLPEAAAPSPGLSTSDSPEAADSSAETVETADGPSVSPERRTWSAKRPSAGPDQNEAPPLSVTHLEAVSKTEASNPLNRAIVEVAPIETGKQTSAAKASSSANSNSIHEKPPESVVVKPANQPEKKDSGFKSMFKKAGKILKKPFGEN